MAVSGDTCLNTPAVTQCPLAYHARQQPHHPAWLRDHCSLSYAELEHRVGQLQRYGAALGARHGHRILYSGQDPLTTVALLLASLREGWLLHPLSAKLSAHDQAHSQAQLQPDLIWPQSDDGWQTLHPASPPARLPASTALSAVRTSGSSGNARLVVHGYQQHYASAQASQQRLPLNPADRWLLSLPLYHIGGLALVMRTLIAGATLVCTEAPLLEAAARFAVTHLSLVATQLTRLLREPQWPPTLRHLLLGGGPVAPELIRAAQTRGVETYLSYGSTELCSQIATAHGATDHVGPPLSGIELKLTDQHEICLRGATLATGQLVDGQLQPLTDAQGWFHSRDCGALNNGNLLLKGRLDNQFISGGENIQPEAVEAVLNRCPGVEAVFVVPLPSAEWGQRPCALVSYLNGQTTLETIAAYANAQLDRIQCPDAFLALPPPQGLKYNRAALRSYALNAQQQGLIHCR